MRIFREKRGLKGLWTAARHGVAVMLVLLALAAPRLITAAPLDLLAAREAQDDPAEKPGENFPGSAFFFAQGAFDPVPGAATLQSEHVLGLDAVQAAPAMAFRGLTALDSYRALNCLTSAIYYEAGSEPEEGQRAVAQVVLNRVRNPAWPKSVCGVIYQGSERADYRCQFTFSCDGSMMRVADTAGWARARRIADRIYLTCGMYEPLITPNRSMETVFRQAGMEVRYVEARDGHNWENWRDRLRDGLGWLHPGDQKFVYE